MKKFILIILSILAINFNCVGQRIYSEKLFLDKFDDVIKTEEIKTRVEFNDSTIFIQEKGHEIQKYEIYFISHRGDENNLIDLTGTSIYGYETLYSVLGEKGHGLIIVDRRVSHIESSFYYKTEALWIWDITDNDLLGKNISRIIYSR